MMWFIRKIKKISLFLHEVWKYKAKFYAKTLSVAAPTLERALKSKQSFTWENYSSFRFRVVKKWGCKFSRVRIFIVALLLFLLRNISNTYSNILPSFYFLDITFCGYRNIIFYTHFVVCSYLSFVSGFNMLNQKIHARNIWNSIKSSNWHVINTSSYRRI